jgi:hypothetical protein
MSARHRDGTAAEPQGDPQQYLVKLHRSWARGNRDRLRRLAAVTLYANGWRMEMIARAMGWKARGHAARMVHATIAELQQYFRDMNEAGTTETAEPNQFHLEA